MTVRQKQNLKIIRVKKLRKIIPALSNERCRFRKEILRFEMKNADLERNNFELAT